ncbi:MAG: copper amine oxidase N-terminal domain-containing protein [Firmicutes bacterium]|nr:copper amine oxidase N-terminal domain-containing protein [Bacillota bacterium]
MPVRGVFESLGFTVNWDSATNKASISDGVHEVSVIKGLNYFKADGKEIYPDVPQQIINGSFYLPLRAIGDAVGANTSWDNENKMAHISYNGKDVYVKIGGINSENTSSAVKQTSSVKYYSKFTQVPDLGAYFGINGVEVSDNQYLYGWDEFMSVYDRLEEYTDLLIKNGFVFMKNDSGASSIEGNASVNLIYYRKDILVMLSVSTYGLVITMG